MLIDAKVGSAIDLKRRIDNYLWGILNRTSQHPTPKEDCSCVEDGTDQNTANPQGGAHRLLPTVSSKALESPGRTQHLRHWSE